MTQTNSDKTPLILVVDDDRTMRSLLTLAMEEEGYQITEANNGEQCISEYTRLQPDLVLLDAVMPDLDGFTCCQRIRSLPGGDRVPILMITVLDDRESVEQAFNAGATDYITKPIHWEVLSQRVRRLLTADRAWLEVEALKEQLRQQQTWEELMRKILQQLSQSDRLSESMGQVLMTIREWLEASRVMLYRTETLNSIESVAPSYPTIKEFSEFDLNLLREYGEHYQQGKSVVIENIAEANLSSAFVEQMKQLDTQAVSIIPIRNGERLVGLLSLHSSQPDPQWQKANQNRFSDLANLLAITLE